MPNQDIQDINYTDPNSIVPEAYKSETIDLNQPQQEQYENANVVSPIVQEIQPEPIMETTATVTTQFEGITAEELEGYDPTEDNTAEAIAIINGSFGAPTNEVVDQVINDIITPVEETPKEEVKQEVKEAPVQPVREEVKVVEGVIINGHSIPVEDHKKEESHNVFIEDIKPIIPLGGVKGPLSIKLTESVIKHVLSFGYRVATLNEDGSRFYVHTDANGKLKVKK